jgi:hypothetical protein
MNNGGADIGSFIVIILILTIFYGMIGGFIAFLRGRSFVAWTFISIFITPLITAVIVFVLENPNEIKRRHKELVEAVKRNG